VPSRPRRLRKAPEKIRWPEGRDFAFTIFDDTDHARLPAVETVYDFLHDLGFRTTKSVWPLRGKGSPKVGGLTCEDRAYLAFVHRLQARGFEIGLHNVTFTTSSREQTARGLDRFRDLFGQNPVSHSNHTGCDECIYWGNSRLTGLNETAYNVLTRFRNRGTFRGHVESSRLFWGDLCRERVTYVRNFVFGDINTLKACPSMPYHDPRRPYVRAWFASAEGPACQPFCRTVDEEAQDRLAAEGGACIMYAHLSKDFTTDGRVDRRFGALMRRLSKMNGWFVPVRTLLDYIASVRGVYTLRDRERTRIERRWLAHKLRTRGTT
jgi:hypothetical protein